MSNLTRKGLLVGYARTSTAEQEAGLHAQIRDLQAAGCTKIFQEQVSSIAERTELGRALEYVRGGDTLVVIKVDRLARSTVGLWDIVKRLEAVEDGGLAFACSTLAVRRSTPRARRASSFSPSLPV